MNRDKLCHALRQRLKRLPPPFEAHYGIVPLPPPEVSLSLKDVIIRHGEAIAALAHVETLAGELTDPYILSRILPRCEAVSSSSIEGTNSTLDELLSVEETEDGEACDAAKQVRDYALALDAMIPQVQKQGYSIFTEALTKELHRLVMSQDSQYPDIPGELRSRVVWIGAGNIAYSTYNPTPPEDIAFCLEETMSYMRCEGMQLMTQSLITRMAVAHSHFEAVHPFRDGNGRVGRLLWPLMMAAEGHIPLYLSPYIAAHKADYETALKAAQQRLEWYEMVGFISDAIIGTVKELLITRTALLSLHEHWYKRRKFRQGSAAIKAIDVLPHYPVLTAKRLAHILKVSIPAATTAIDQLLTADILKEQTGHSRNRVFSVHEALHIMNRPFGQEPIVPEA